jgi:glycosyltransferase involved in cell wall biosynthesis
MRELSILIPSRNEEFLKRTVEDILSNIEADTEIIVVLDGYTTDLPEHPRLRVIHNPESIGQRAATNQACKLSKAKYVMKVDAHCAFDKGFDRKLISLMQDDYTMIPLMRNLHVFNWICPEGHRRYQSPSGPCKECNADTIKEIVWISKTNPQSSTYCFDSEPHFQYFNDFKKRPEYKDNLEKGLTETMSIQGSCFMLTRDKYWELDICDESFGSWGSQGIEVACKTWLSGGRVVVNHKTWYAHMFRTQGGDFGFPYPLSGEQTNKAKALSRQIWFDNLWPKQTKPLSWLLEKFWPIPGWTEEQLIKMKAWPLPNKNLEKKAVVTAGIVYYTDNRLDEKIMKRCQEQLKKSGLPIINVSLQPLDFGDNIVLPLKRSPESMFKQILAGLEKLQTDIVFLCEHDVLYHPSHFDFRPPEKNIYYYNYNTWQLRASDGHAVSFDARRVSQLCADRKFLVEHYKKRIALVESVGFSRHMGFEPGMSQSRPQRVDDFKAGKWRSEFPNIDIKHGKNLTEVRWKQSEFNCQKNCRNWKETDDIEGWGKGSGIL